MDPGYFYFVILFLRQVQSLVDFFLGLVIGYQTKTGKVSQHQEATTNYERSAQVVDIWMRGAYTAAATHQLDNFLYTHKAYVNPNYVLTNDNITLHGCTPTHVFFCVTSPVVDLYQCVNHPFMFISQFLLAKRLVIIPHWALHQLVEEEGDHIMSSDKELIFIGMTGRCGSTLLCQMFNKLPKTTVMSEPWALLHAREWYHKGSFARNQYEKLVGSLAKLLLKDRTKMTEERLVVKLPMMNMPQFNRLHNTFPRAKFFLSTRHPKASMISYCKFFQAGIFGLFEKYQKPDFWNANLPFDRDDRYYNDLAKELKLFPVSAEEDFVTYYAGPIVLYLKTKDMFSHCIIYEEMLKDPEGETTKLFEALKVDQSLVPLALTALERHSQNKIFGDTSKDSYAKIIDKSGFDRCDIMFDRMQLPIRIGMSLEAFSNLMH